MKAAIIKYLFWEELYNMRQVALIAETTEDYVRKVVHGERAAKVKASYEGITEGMLRRKDTIDKIMSLQGAYFVDGEQKYNYISLLSYLGYTTEELLTIFSLDKDSFVRIAALRSYRSWRFFDSTTIGIPQEDYKFTFLDKVKTYIENSKQQEEQDRTSLEWKREHRKMRKMASKNGL